MSDYTFLMALILFATFLAALGVPQEKKDHELTNRYYAYKTCLKKNTRKECGPMPFASLWEICLEYHPAKDCSPRPF